MKEKHLSWKALWNFQRFGEKKNAFLDKIKAKYCRCWNLKQQMKMLEHLSRSDIICGESPAEVVQHVQISSLSSKIKKNMQFEMNGKRTFLSPPDSCFIFMHPSDSLSCSSKSRWLKPLSAAVNCPPDWGKELISSELSCRSESVSGKCTIRKASLPRQYSG